MARFSAWELWVVVYPHTGGYSYDTQAPDEVFSDRAEAEAHAAELNAHAEPFLGVTLKEWRVESLGDRVDTVRWACRDEGAANERESRQDYD